VYQLHPLEIPNVEAPPLRRRKPRSPTRRPWEGTTILPAPPTESTERLVPPMLTVDTTLAAPDATDASGEVIRFVRSPSIHRNYGETSSGRRRSSKTPADGDGAEEEEERIGLTSAHRHSSLTVPSEEVLARSRGRKGDDDGDAVPSRRRAASLSLPKIEIETPTPATIGRHLSLEKQSSPSPPAGSGGGSLFPHTQEHRLRSSFEKYRTSGLSSPMEETEDHLSAQSRLPAPPPPSETERRPSAPSGTEDRLEEPESEASSFASLDEEDRRDGKEDDEQDPPPPLISINDASPSMSSLGDTSSSLLSSLDKASSPPLKFVAFPMLNRHRRWFDSTKAAMLCCGLTTAMVLAAIIYNIILAAHGQPQG
jgi:hypothetical protein